MPGKPSFVIKVAKGNVDKGSLNVRTGEAVHWVPIKTDVTVQLDFGNESPFDKTKFPDNPVPGHAVSAIVRDDAKPKSYPYRQPGSRRARPGFADPVIIVRDSRRKGKKKKAAKRVARKK